MVSAPQHCPLTGAAADSSDYYNGVDLPPSESESEYEYGSEGGSDDAPEVASKPQRPHDAAVEPGRAAGNDTSDNCSSVGEAAVAEAAVAITVALHTDAEEAAASGEAVRQVNTAACNAKSGCDAYLASSTNTAAGTDVSNSTEAASGGANAASRAQQDESPTRHQSSIALPAVGCNAGGAATVHKGGHGSEAEWIPASDVQSDGVEGSNHAQLVCLI